jgi:hypothetical protein
MRAGEVTVLSAHILKEANKMKDVDGRDKRGHADQSQRPLV